MIKLRMNIKVLAFSVAEAFIMLLIVSVALGAAAPIVTKQIKHNNLSNVQTNLLGREIDRAENNINRNATNINNLSDDMTIIAQRIDALYNNEFIQGILGPNSQTSYDTDIAELRADLDSGLAGKADSNMVSQLEQQLVQRIDELEDRIEENGIPRGTVAFFNLTSCPSGWSAVSQNWNGRFPRFAGSYTVLSYNTSTKNLNSTGTAQTLNVGATQEDAIRNITGEITVSTRSHASNVWSNAAKLAFSAKDNYYWGIGGGGGGGREYYAMFNANNIVPTSIENRPRSIALLGCVKN